MKKIKSLLALVATAMLVGCSPKAESKEQGSSEAPVSEQASSQTVSLFTADGWKVDFVCDAHATYEVYTTEEYTTKQQGPNWYATSETGEITKGDETNTVAVYFKVIPAEGWTAAVSATEGTYNKLKTPGDQKIDNAYKLTKVTADTTITIACTENSAVKGWKVTFDLGTGIQVKVYKDQAYTIEDTDTQIQTRNCKDEPYPYCNDGNDSQVCFKVIYSGAGEIEVTATEGTFKNIKDPEETAVADCWRITKITGDITVTIRAK